MLGRSLPVAELASTDSLEEFISSTVALLREPFQRAQTAQSPLADIRPARSEPPENLTALKESFIAETGYPTDDDRKHQLLLREWQPELTPERLASVPVSTLRRMYNGGGYGSPGPQSILNSSLAGEDPDVIDRFVKRSTTFSGLRKMQPTGLTPLWTRPDSEYVAGEGAIMKFLAIAHPDDFSLCTFSGERGKAAILTALGKPAPPLTALFASVKWLQTTPSMTQFVISSLTTHGRERNSSIGFTKGRELRQHEISTEPLRQQTRIQSPMQPMTSRSRQISSKTSEISFPKIDRWSFTALQEPGRPS